MNHFEKLPTELMDEIIAYLDDSELLPLLSCSSAFWSYIMSVLDRRENGKDTAMRWACSNGHLPLIRYLVSHGAPPSTIDIEWRHSDKPRDRCVRKRSKILTLYLAATRKQVRVFQLLIQLGARIDCPGVEKKALRRLVDRICDPVDDWAFLRLFYEHGFHTQVCFTHYPQLERVIRRHASATTSGPMQMLLDKGISPNERHVRCRNRPETPLVAAIRLTNRPTFDLLMRHGAHIEGPNLTHPVKRPWPIPIFVAAEKISQNGFEWSQICLENGADINHCAWEKIERSSGYPIYRYRTPFLVYLESISGWDPQPSIVDPVQAINFLIDRGAWVEQPLHPPIENSDHDHRLSLTPWGFEFLLTKWGPITLHDFAGFRTIVYFLLKKAVENGTLGESLARYDYTTKTWRSKRDNEVVGIWQALLTYLLEDQQVDPTTLLYQYIFHKGRLADKLKDVGQVTIERLLAAGASIHARLEPNGPTVLEALCRTYNYQAHKGLEICRAFRWRVHDNRRELFRFLVSKGITEAPVSAALDLLLFDTDGMADRNNSELRRMARILTKER